MIARSHSDWALFFCRQYFGFSDDEDVSLPVIRKLWADLGPGMYVHPLFALRQEWFHTQLVPLRMVPSFFDEGDRLLDFGCGTAEFARRNWIEKGKATILCDMGGPIFTYTQAKYTEPEHNIVATIDLGMVADESVDRLVCVDVLEHVENPMEIIDAVWAKLAPGGQALIWFDYSYPHPGHLKESIEQRPAYHKWLSQVSDMVYPHTAVNWVRKRRKPWYRRLGWQGKKTEQQTLSV